MRDICLPGCNRSWQVKINKDPPTKIGNVIQVVTGILGRATHIRTNDTSDKSSPAMPFPDASSLALGHSCWGGFMVLVVVAGPILGGSSQDGLGSVATGWDPHEKNAIKFGHEWKGNNPILMVRIYLGYGPLPGSESQ